MNRCERCRHFELICDEYGEATEWGFCTILLDKDGEDNDATVDAHDICDAFEPA